MIFQISIIIIAAFIVIFVIGMLVVLFQVRRTAKEIEKFMEMARQQLAPLSHDMTIILSDARRIVDSVKVQTNKMESGFDAIRDVALNIKRMEMEFQDRVEEPLLEIAAFFTAFVSVFKGVANFFSKNKR